MAPPDLTRQFSAATGAGVPGRIPPPPERSAVAPTATTVLDRDRRRCPVCDREVAAGQRFCRCGATLTPVVRAGVTARSMIRVPWYRRLGELIGSGRDFRRSMRSANGGVRAVYSATLSVRARIVRASLLLGALGIGVSQLGPWGPGLRGQLQDQITARLPSSYTVIPTKAVATDPSTSALPGFEPAFAVDGNRERAWAASWKTPPDSGTACHRPGGAPSLLVTFARPVTVDRVAIAPGLAAGNPLRELQARPHGIDVLFSDGNCLTVNLRDVAPAQQFRAVAKGVTSVRLTVVDVYQPSDPPKAMLVALGEVRFESRG